MPFPVGLVGAQREISLMKYLLTAIIVMADGGTSGLMPTSWFNTEVECVERGDELRLSMLQEQTAQAAYFDCMAFSPLEIVIIGEALPYRAPEFPTESSK